jgi:hypothetical protein
MEFSNLRSLEEFADKQNLRPTDKTYYVLSEVLNSRKFVEIKLSELESSFIILQRKKDKSKITSIFSKKAKIKFTFRDYLELFWKALNNSSELIV